LCAVARRSHSEWRIPCPRGARTNVRAAPRRRTHR
jgi:hypothetical protein